MPASKKTSKPTTAKSTVKTSKPATQAMKPVAGPAPAAKPTSSSFRTITQAERQRMIEEAAYYRAERANFSGDPDEHWNASEREIDTRLAREHVRVA